MSIAAAILWGRMGHPITSGRLLRRWWRLPALVGVILLAGGCATEPAADAMRQQIEAAQRHSDGMLRQTRAEANAQRAELAAARIAAAKQAAELQELREQFAELRQANEARQAEHVALRGERDRLIQARNDPQVQVSEVPRLGPNTIESKTAEGKAQVRVRELETALLMLSAELEQVKKKTGRHKGKPSPGIGKAPTPQIITPSAAEQMKPRAKGSALAGVQETPLPAFNNGTGVFPVMVQMKDRSGPSQVIVRRDETLWRIARRFGVTVDRLREANGLEGNLIIEGQTLVIPGR